MYKYKSGPATTNIKFPNTPIRFMGNSIIALLITLSILGFYCLLVKSWRNRGNLALTIRKRILSR